MQAQLRLQHLLQEAGCSLLDHLAVQPDPVGQQTLRRSALQRNGTAATCNNTHNVVSGLPWYRLWDTAALGLAKLAAQYGHMKCIWGRAQRRSKTKYFCKPQPRQLLEALGVHTLFRAWTAEYCTSSMGIGMFIVELGKPVGLLHTRSAGSSGLTGLLGG